jgi:hypothetical protein
VDESQRCAGPEDLGPRQGARDPGDAGELVARESRDRLDVGAITEDRHGPRDLGGLRGKAGESHQDIAGDGARADLRDHRRVAGGRGRTLDRQSAEQLAQQQGVASRDPAAVAAELLVGSPRQALLDHSPDCVEAERARPDGDGRWRPGHVGDEARIDARIGAAQAGYDPDRGPLEPMAEVGEKSQRRPVAPVQIVDEEQQRRLRAEVHGHPVEAVKRRERHVLARRLASGNAEDRLRWSRGLGQGDRSAGLVDHLGLEQLADDAEGEVHLELAAASGELAEPPLRRELADGDQEGALADAGRPLDEERAPTPLQDQVEGSCGRVELALPLDKPLVRSDHRQERTRAKSDGTPLRRPRRRLGSRPPLLPLDAGQ